MASEDQLLIKQSAAALGQRLARAKGHAATGPNDVLAAIAESGFVTMLVAEDRCGSGLSVADLCVVAEQLGSYCVRAPFVHAAVGAWAIGQAPTGHLDAMLARIAGGTQMVLPAFQATADGAATPLRAHSVDGGLFVDGARVAMPVHVDGAGVRGCEPAPWAFVVDAILDGDAAGGAMPLLLFVRADAKGLHLEHRESVDGTAQLSARFEHVPIGPKDVIARGAQALGLKACLEAALKLGLAAEQLGLAQSAFSATLEYARTRVQFGRTIGSFQAVRHRLVDEYARIESMRSLIGQIASSEREPNEWNALASGVKLKADESALAVLRAAIQLHGAIGFTLEHEVGHRVRRSLTLAALGGSPRHLVRSYSQRPGSGDELPSLRGESDEDRAFRLEVRTWLEDHLPAHLRDLIGRPAFADAMQWHRMLHAQGWIAPAWPREYGGMGASLTQRLILQEEFGRAGAPEMSHQAIDHIGPILMAFGTAEQKRLHLPRMLTGEAIWCQGYSEPNAGSDLASLRTAAVLDRDGKHLVVNGQKTWTTWGHYAHWMFALVRTDPNAPRKQEGITFLLIDLNSPGITRRPIVTIAGEDELAEVFLDDVRVPVSNVVGKVNDGWRVANALLTHERLRSATPQRCITAFRRIRRMAAAGADTDAALRDRLARAELDVLTLSAAFERAVALEQGGRLDAGAVPYIKLMASQLTQDILTLGHEAAGSNAGLLAPDSGASAALALLQSLRLTIFGGTAEIQRDIIAKRVLHLD